MQILQRVYEVKKGRKKGEKILIIEDDNKRWEEINVILAEGGASKRFF